jgi:hypothetical protein
MVVATWIALAAMIVSVGASLGLAAARGWRAWRTFRSFSRSIGRALDAVLASAAAAEERAVSLSAHTERLTLAVSHLQGSLDRVGRLRAAAGETQAAIARLRGAVPRK